MSPHFSRLRPRSLFLPRPLLRSAVQVLRSLLSSFAFALCLLLSALPGVAQVLALNHAPEAYDGGFELDEDKSVSGQIVVLGATAPIPEAAPSVRDIDGQSLTLKLEEPPRHGALQFQSSGAFTYTPRANFNGEDHFLFSVSDGKLASSGLVRLTVNPINDEPEADEGAFAVSPDAANPDMGAGFVGYLKASDVDFDELVYEIFQQPTAGTVTIKSEEKATGRFTYKNPDPKFRGVETFSFRVRDALSVSDPAVVTLVVGDGIAYFGDTLTNKLAGVDVSGDELEVFSKEIGPIRDLEVDRANRRLYALTESALHIFEIDPEGANAAINPVVSDSGPDVVSISGGTHLALSLDARTAYIATLGKVIAVNLYSEGHLAAGGSTHWEKYQNRREYPYSPPERAPVAFGIHPAGDRLLLVTAAEKDKVDVNNDLLRSDVGSGTRSEQLTDADLPSDFGYLLQLEIPSPARTVAPELEEPEFSAPVDIKRLIYTEPKAAGGAPAVAVGIKHLAFSPDGNCAFLPAVGGQTVRATPFGIMPTTDEGTGGIVVLDVRPRPEPETVTPTEGQSPESWVAYLGFIPTTERGEKTAELRGEIRKEGWRIVHPTVQWARNLYLEGEGAFGLGGSNQFIALTTLTQYTLGSIVLAEMEESFKDYGYMEAYARLYPRDMVGAVSLAINRLGDFGVVGFQNTNNLGLLTLSSDDALPGYGGSNSPPDFYIQRGTGKIINGFDQGLSAPSAESNYEWAYPQEVALSSDDSRLFVGMAGGVPSADLTNRFGHADAANLRVERDRADSVLAGTNPPPGYDLAAPQSLFRSPRQVATRQSHDADFDADGLSDQTEAFNRWNSLRVFPKDAKRVAMVDTEESAADLFPGSPVARSHPGKPFELANPGKDDAFDKGFFLPVSGLGYRFDDQAQPPLALNAGSRSALNGVELIGRLWHDAYLKKEDGITRPYIVVGVLSRPGGGQLQNAQGEDLQYATRNGFQVNFPYPSLDSDTDDLSDAPHDFVLSNGAATPRDNTKENLKGFDVLHTAKFLQLLFAAKHQGRYLATRIELDPAVRDLLTVPGDIPDIDPGLATKIASITAKIDFHDPRFSYHGLREPRDNTSRRDLDSQLAVSFSPLVLDAQLEKPKPLPGLPPPTPGLPVYLIKIPDGIDLDTAVIRLPFTETYPEFRDDYIVRYRKSSGEFSDPLVPGQDYKLSDILKDALLDAEGRLALSINQLNPEAKPNSIELFAYDEDGKKNKDNVFSLLERFEGIRWNLVPGSCERLASREEGSTTIDDSQRTQVHAETVGFEGTVTYRRVAWEPDPARLPTGPSSPATINAFTGEILAGRDAGVIVVEALSVSPEGEELRTDHLRIPVGCASCASGTCESIGFVAPPVDPLRGMEFSVSDGADGGISFWSAETGDKLTDTRAITYGFRDPDTRIVYGPDQAIRQIVTAHGLFDIVKALPPASGYTITSSPAPADPSAAFNPVTGLYSSGGPALSSLTVAPTTDSGSGGGASPTGALITTIQDGRTERHAYRYDAGANTWTLDEFVGSSGGNPLRSISISRSGVPGYFVTGLPDYPKTTGLPASGGQHTLARIVRDAEGATLAHTVQTMDVTPLGGLRLRTVTEDPAGLARGTAYDDYHDSGQPRSIRYPDGGWERIDYDSAGRVEKRIRPWLNADFGAPESECVVTTYDYTPLVPVPDGQPVPEPRSPRTTITLTRGVETSRSYDHYEPGLHRSIVATHPGAAWDDPANLVTTTRYVGSDPLLATRYSSFDPSGRVASVVSPDGTATLYSYEQLTETDPANPARILRILGERTVTLSGVPDSTANPTTITDGTRTVTEQNTREHLVASTTTDIASGLVLDSREALETDRNGRPTLWGYHDGTTSRTVYGCCGVESETDRLGITTTYLYDRYKRVETETRLGITTRYRRDGLGRVTHTYRIGTDGTEQLLARTDYLDRLGESTDHFDARDRKTSSRVAHLADGSATRTTTLPGGDFTQLLTSARDGRPLSTGGTAAAPMRYEYRTDTLDGIPHQVTRAIALVLDEQTGLLRDTEWTETWADFVGRTVLVVGADGARARSRYNAKGQLVQVTDPDGVSTLYAYDARGRLSVTALDVDRDDEIDYFGPDRITRGTTTYATKVWDGVAHPVARATTELWPDFDSDTPLLVQTTESSLDGRHSWSTRFEQTAHQQTLLPATPDGSWQTRSTAPDHTYTVATYAAGRVQNTASYDRDDQLLGRLSYDYDRFGRLWKTTDLRLGLTGTTTYYPDDQVETVTSPHPEGEGRFLLTTLHYDPRGLLHRRVLPDLTETTYTYTAQGQLDRVSGSQTYPIDYDYDSQGRLLRMTTWRDYAGQSGAATTAWAYHPQTGRLASKTYPAPSASGSTSTVLYAYKPSGRLETRTWARGLITTYGYHPDGALATVDYADADTPDLAYAHHRHGSVAEVRDGTLVDGEIADAHLRYRHAYAFDAELRPDTETVQTFGLHQLTRHYEPGTAPGQVPGRYAGFDLLDSTRYSLLATRYSFDPAGRLQTVATPAGSFTYAYLNGAPGLVETVAGPAHVARNTYQPKGYGLSAKANTTVADDTLVSRFAYKVNELGQRESLVTTGAAFVQPSQFAFRYDEKGQLIHGDRYEGEDPAQPGAPILPDTFAYTFDDIGNRKKSTRGAEATPFEQRDYTANLLNQYTDVSVHSSLVTRHSSPLHDPDGNLTDDGRWLYTWDGENRLIRIEAVVGLTAGQASVRLEFTYDYQGRRVTKRIFAAEESGGLILTAEQGFLYDGWNLIATSQKDLVTSHTSLVTLYSWGLDLSGGLQGAGGVGGLLAVTDVSDGSDSSDPSFFPTYDGNGNISEYLALDGEVAAHYEYGPFGELLRASGPLADSAAFVFRFSTKYLDAESGLYYYGFRYYQPENGRWLSRDPIEERGGVNLYGMVGNAPLGYLDVLGLAPINDTIRAGVIRDIQNAADIAELIHGPNEGSLDLANAKHKTFAEILSKSEHAGYIVIEQSINKEGMAINRQSYVNKAGDQVTRYAPGSRRPDVMVLADSDYKGDISRGGGAVCCKGKIDVAVDLKTGTQGITAEWRADVSKRIELPESHIVEVRPGGKLGADVGKLHARMGRVASVVDAVGVAHDVVIGVRKAVDEAGTMNPYVGEVGGVYYSMMYDRIYGNYLPIWRTFNRRLYFWNGPLCGQEVPLSVERWEQLNDQLEQEGKTYEDRFGRRREDSIQFQLSRGQIL